MSAGRTLHAVAALLWLQGRRGSESTTSVAAVIGAGRHVALRVLRQLAEIGAVRCVGQREHGRSGCPPLLWEAVGFDEALDAVLARGGER